MPVLDEGLREFAVCSDSEIEYSYPICRFEIVPQGDSAESASFFSSLLAFLTTVKFWWPFPRKRGAGVLRVVYFHLLLSVKLCVLSEPESRKELVLGVACIGPQSIGYS